MEGDTWIPLTTLSDWQVYNRYLTAELEAKHDTLYFQDDDVIFRDHKALLSAFNTRDFDAQWVANKQPGLDEAQGYWDLALVGCGSLVPRGVWGDAFRRYREAYRNDERFTLDADFIFGVLSKWKKVDLGLEVLPAASAPNRLWRQKGQMEGKHASINKARALRTIVLTMLTKNEQANVVRALDSARPLYDRVLIHDTGSTDDTVLEVSRWCSANGIPHTIAPNVPFEGFGQNRNALLREGRKLGDYMLLMDADEEFVKYDTEADAVARPELFCDAYMLHYDGALDYAQPRILFSNYPWRFDEVKSHAALDDNDPAADHRPIGCDMQAPRILHHDDAQTSTEERYRRDIANLTDDIRHGREVARAYFMRGKAFEGLAAVTRDEEYKQDAIRDYKKRVALSTGDEESYYSRFRLGCLLVETGKFASGADELFSAWMDRPRRIESLRALAAYCTAVADATPYPVGDMIIVHRDLYRDSPQTEGA